MGPRSLQERWGMSSQGRGAKAEGIGMTRKTPLKRHIPQRGSKSRSAPQGQGRQWSVVSRALAEGTEQVKVTRLRPTFPLSLRAETPDTLTSPPPPRLTTLGGGSWSPVAD